MPTIGTNVVTSIVNRHIIPEIVDNIYNSNPLWFRWNSANKRIVRGGTHIEIPLLYSRFTSGGFYSGLDDIDVTPQDTVKNGSWNWKQAGLGVSFDGLTLAKTDDPGAIANIISFTMDQAEMEMAEILGSSLWNTGSNVKELDSIRTAIAATGSYAGIDRTSTNTWWRSAPDTTSPTLTMPLLESQFTTCTVGGRAPTIIVSRADQYNRFWNLNQVSQTHPTMPGGTDEQLARAGFHNQLFNGVPWVIDSHVPNGTGADSSSRVYMLNEDYWHWVVNSRADFYLEPFQQSQTKDAITAKLLWYGNLICTNVARQGGLFDLES